MADRLALTGFVTAQSDALRKRARAIRHRGAKLTWSESSDSVGDPAAPLARLDVDCRYGAPRTSLRIIAWEDRWIWFDARRGSKNGWVWAATLEGRLLSPDSAQPLVTLLERSLDATNEPIEAIEATLASLWSPHLAHGPRRV